MDLYSQLRDFKADLDNLAHGNASWPLASAFNALLEQAKTAAPDNAIVAQMQPVQQAATGQHSTTDTGTLKVLAGQLVSALRPELEGPGFSMR